MRFGRTIKMPLPGSRQRRAMNVGRKKLTDARDKAAVVSRVAASGSRSVMAEYAGPSPKMIAGEAARQRREVGAEAFTVAMINSSCKNLVCSIKFVG